MVGQYDAPLGLYIGGEWLSGGGREVAEVLNPATGSAQGRLPLATASDLDVALEAAQRGFLAWRETPPEARAVILSKTAALIGNVL